MRTKEGVSPEDWDKLNARVSRQDNVGTGIEGAGNKVINHNSDIALPSLRTKEGVSPEDWDKLNARVSRQDNVGTGTMKIRKGDKVKMLSGKDRNKTGKVTFVFPAAERLVVEGLNLIKKHQRARQQGQKGQIISKERAVAVASVQLICPSCAKPARIGHRLEGDKKIRYCKQCQMTI